MSPLARVLAALALALGLSGPPAAASPPAAAGAREAIAWQDWSEAAFERARREGRFVLLDLGAVWCHWCHVMEETTYEDPKIIALIKARYVAVRVDQDARPDLSNRYEDYGWPATIIFDGNGRELVRFSGYIPPLRMASLLQGVIDDPSPGPSARSEAEPPSVSEAALSPALQQQLSEMLVARYDAEHGGWGFVKKFLDWDAVEYSLVRAREGDAAAERRARETLSAELNRPRLGRRLEEPLREALRAAEWLLKNHALPGGGYRHDAVDAAGPYLGDLELRTEPLHLTVIGHRDDPAARALLASALAEPVAYKRVELWDKREGPLPRADVEYPELKNAAAFLCAEGRCSAPAYTPQELKAGLERAARRREVVSR